MSYRLSRQDIRFMHIAYKITNILGIAPSYSFRQYTIVHPTRDKIVTACLMAIFAFTSSMAIHKRLIIFSRIYSLQNIILDILKDLMFLLFLFSILFQLNFKCQLKWKKLNDDFQLLDDRMGNVNKKVKGILKNVYFQLMMWLTLNMILLVYIMHAWLHLIGIRPVLESYPLLYVFRIYDILAQFLLVNLVLAFYIRYAKLNATLENYFVCYQSKVVILKKMNFVREIRSLSILLTEMVNTFNDIFGWPLVFVTGNTCFQMLSCLNYYIEKLPRSDESFKKGLFISNTSGMFISLVTITCIIMACDGVVTESERTGFLCHKLQDSLPKDCAERQELLRFSRQTCANVAKFTAAGFFEINRSTLLGIIGTVTTNFIVLLQFSDKSDKQNLE